MKNSYEQSDIESDRQKERENAAVLLIEKDKDERHEHNDEEFSSGHGI